MQPGAGALVEREFRVLVIGIDQNHRHGRFGSCSTAAGWLRLGFGDQPDVPERAKLVVRHQTVRDGLILLGPIQVHLVESDDVSCRVVVTGHALIARAEMPGLLLFCAAYGGIGDGQFDVAAIVRHQRGVSLLVVPLIGIAVPATAVEMQKLGFDFAESCHVPGHPGQRQRADKHGVRREDAFPIVVVGHVFRTGDGDEAVGCRAIHPLRGIDVKRDHARTGPQSAGIGKEAGFAEFAGENPGSPQRRGFSRSARSRPLRCRRDKARRRRLRHRRRFSNRSGR